MVPISIRDLTKTFGGQTVLDRVSLEIGQGELFFLLGPSGCGKTTLLRHLAGFYEPDAGSIHFGTEEVTRQPAHKRGTGMMFQSYALWPHLTVAQNVAFGLEERKVPRAEIQQRVGEVLEVVKLGGLGARRIPQLSGGQQQRVALARALVIRPRCLLLDEPLSNLDAKLRHEMRAEIRRICKEFGLTGTYVTHDRDEALSMADRLAVMHGGRLAQVGTPQEVYRNPASRMVAEFIGETNLLPGTYAGPAEGAEAGLGLHRVETATGVLLGRLPPGARAPVVGGKALLSLRPEALAFPPAGALPGTGVGATAGPVNVLPGQVVDTMYLGATVRYEMRLAGGDALQVCETNPHEIRAPGSEEVRAVAAAQDTLLLPAETV